MLESCRRGLTTLSAMASEERGVRSRHLEYESTCLFAHIRLLAVQAPRQGNRASEGWVVIPSCKSPMEGPIDTAS